MFSYINVKALWWGNVGVVFMAAAHSMKFISKSIGNACQVCSKLLSSVATSVGTLAIALQICKKITVQLWQPGDMLIVEHVCAQLEVVPRGLHVRLPQERAA